MSDREPISSDEYIADEENINDDDDDDDEDEEESEDTDHFSSQSSPKTPVRLRPSAIKFSLLVS